MDWVLLINNNTDGDLIILLAKMHLGNICKISIDKAEIQFNKTVEDKVMHLLNSNLAMMDNLYLIGDKMRINDTWINDKRMNDTWINDKRMNDTWINDTWINDTRMNDTRINDTWISDMRINDMRINDMMPAVTKRISKIIDEESYHVLMVGLSKTDSLLSSNYTSLLALKN
jgi:hypothetical protein